VVNGVENLIQQRFPLLNSHISVRMSILRNLHIPLQVFLRFVQLAHTLFKSNALSLPFTITHSTVLLEPRILLFQVIHLFLDANGELSTHLQPELTLSQLFPQHLLLHPTPFLNRKTPLQYHFCLSNRNHEHGTDRSIFAGVPSGHSIP
jgi:hypothetical protein